MKWQQKLNFIGVDETYESVIVNDL